MVDFYRIMVHKPIAISMIAPVAVAAILILGILAGISSTAVAGKTVSKTVKTPYVSKTVKTPYVSKTVKTPYVSKTVKTPYVSKTVKTPYVSKTVKTPYVSKTVKMTFTAKLTGNNEVPPVKTPATGIAHFELSSDGKVLNYVLSTTNLKGFKYAGIYKGETGENGLQGADLSMGKGKITSYDLSGSMEDGQISDVVKLIKSGEAYVNVVTHQNQDGEIRGQIS